MNILIVDDEEFIRKSVIKTIELSELKFDKIFQAEDAQEALKILEKENFDVEIVITDINMPNINGLELTKIIKSKNQNVAIGIISGYDHFEYMREAIKLGVDDYILKPTTKTDILSFVKNLLDISEKIKKDESIKSLANVVNENFSSNNVIDKALEKLIYNKELTLTTLADEINMSSSYLSNIFKKKYGIPFQDYVLKKRMEKAAILLISTNLKNYEISEKIGFDSVYYFNLKFKKYYDLTPKEYRNNALKGKV